MILPPCLLTFRNVALVDDLATALARLLHLQRHAHALVVAAQALAALVAHLRHDLRRHRVAVSETSQVQ